MSPRCLSPERRQTLEISLRMARHYIAFDIETAKVIPGQSRDLMVHRPLGIACAATLSSTDDRPRLWHGRTGSQTPAGRMSRDDASELVSFLTTSANSGSTILTWNGLGFDFDILAEESGMLEECRLLALRHVDMMFHVFCELGYPIALDRAAQGMRLPGKSSSVAQHMAPEFWAEGRTDEVLAYVSQDVQATLQLAHTCEEQRELRWIARSGSVRNLMLSAGWLTVEAAMRLPEPDTSWMDNPMRRNRFTGWL